MSMLDLTKKADEIMDAQDPTVAESGTEHKLRIISVREGFAGQNDCPYISPVFECMDNPLVKEFSSFLWVPDETKLTEKQYARSLSEFKNFCKAFDIDLSKPLDCEDDLPGHEGWAILGIKKDDEYGEQNTIRKFQIGS